MDIIEAVNYRKDLENLTYAAWKAAPTLELEVELRRLLESHARAVMFSILRRSDLELVGEAAEKVLLNLPSFRGESEFTTWAHRIIIHIMYDQRRLDRRRKEVSVELFDGFDSANFAVTDALLTVQKVLSPVDYRLFEQMAIYGRSQREAAIELKLPQKTLCYRWNNITRTLRNVFGK